MGGDDSDTGAGLEKAGDFGSCDGAATDDEDGAVVEFEEGGEEGHGIFGSCEHEHFRTENRKASRRDRRGRREAACGVRP